jgi:hypothetical protein
MPALGSSPPRSPSGKVEVYQIGSVYVVDDTAEVTGEFVFAATLSNKYKVLATYSR